MSCGKVPLIRSTGKLLANTHLQRIKERERERERERDGVAMGKNQSKCCVCVHYQLQPGFDTDADCFQRGDFFRMGRVMATNQYRYVSRAGKHAGGDKGLP